MLEWYSWKYSSLFTNCKELEILGTWFYNNRYRIKGNSFLNIGITPDSGITWLHFFKDDLGFQDISSLEICDTYISDLKKNNHPYKLYSGNVKNIDNIFQDNSIDIIGWFQGPEHIKEEELKSTIIKLLNIVRIGIILISPYGIFYSGWETNQKAIKNIYEAHLIYDPVPEIFNNLNLGLDIFTWGEKDSPEAGMCIYKFKE